MPFPAPELLPSDLLFPGDGTSDSGIVPGIGVFLALGNNPTDRNGYAFTTDITPYVRSIHYTRGRQNELNRIEAGEGSILLNDKDRRFDPEYVGSPYYPNVKPIKPIQVQATLLGQTYYLMTHFVERWPRKRYGPTYAEEEVTSVDAFEMLAHAGLGGNFYPVVQSGARVGALLDTASYPDAMRSIAVGQSEVQSASFLSTDSTVALDHLQDIEQSENGMFFVDGRGFAKFIDRHGLIGAPYTTSQATFTDVVTQTGELPVSDIVHATSDKDLIFNDWRLTPDGGITPQTAEDQASIDAYFRRTQTLTTFVTTDGDALAAAQYQLSRFKDPLQRIEQIVLRPGSNQGLWVQCLSRELGDRITVKEHPPPAGTVATIRDYIIQYIEVDLPFGPASNATFTWGLWPADVNSYLILDDANQGQLDFNRLAY